MVWNGGYDILKTLYIAYIIIYILYYIIILLLLDTLLQFITF
jgi:hypothetical protein